MSKSDHALATKEMPFRVYMGYDSHEDITFEVRRRGLLVFVEFFVVVSVSIVHCAFVLDDDDDDF